MISLTQLQAFAAVARHQHFTRAAEELQIAQSSISYQVHELERLLNVRLVEIVGRRVVLTDAGERLFARGTAILNDLEDVTREMRDYGAGGAGRIRIGATHTIGGYALPFVLTAFRAAHPQIELHLRTENVRTIERILLDRTIDLGIVEWPIESPALKSDVLRHDALVLIAPPSHPLVGREPLRPVDLRGQTLVMREPGSGLRALSAQVLGPVFDEITVAMEFDQPEALVRAVESGMGLAFISRAVVATQLARRTVCELPLEGITLGHTYRLVTLADRPSSPAMIAFATFLSMTWKVSDLDECGLPGDHTGRGGGDSGDERPGQQGTSSEIAP